MEFLSLVIPSCHLDSNQNGEGVESGRSGGHKPDKLGLSCKANKCSDVGAGDLGVLPTHDSSPCHIDAGTSKTEAHLTHHLADCEGPNRRHSNGHIEKLIGQQFTVFTFVELSQFNQHRDIPERTGKATGHNSASYCCKLPIRAVFWQGFQ